MKGKKDRKRTERKEREREQKKTIQSEAFKMKSWRPGEKMEGRRSGNLLSGL